MESDNIQPWRQVFDVPIVDLGKSEPRFDGIFTPAPEFGLDKVGVTEQFLESADVYDLKYSRTNHYKKLFERAFDDIGFKPANNNFILDIGSRSGSNSVEPCLQLFDSSQIIATDISPHLLRILKRHIDLSAYRTECFASLATR